MNTVVVGLTQLHAGQAKVLTDCKRFNVANCGRRLGKSVLGINLVCETALDGYPAGWFAPEYKLLTEAWRDIKGLLDPVITAANDQQHRIDLITGGSIEAWAFDRNQNAGRSRRYKRVVVDEAAHCDYLEEVWTRAVRPTLTDFRGDAWFLSSPNGQNYFYRLFLRGDDPSYPDWQSWTLTSYDNPLLDPAEIDAARLDLADWVWEQEYLAKFHAETHTALLPAWWVERLSEPGIVQTCERLRAQGQGGRRRLAADLALGTGRDRTVILVRDDLGVIDHRESPYTGIGAAAQQIAILARDWAIDSDAIVYDAGGPGRDLPRYLEQHQIEAIAYHGGASGGAKFKNRRSKIAWRMRQRLDPDRPVPHEPSPADDGDLWKPAPKPIPPKAQHPFCIPAKFLTSDGREELLGLRYELDGARIALEKKDDFMARLGRSPDYADALMMTFAGVE